MTSGVDPTGKLLSMIYALATLYAGLDVLIMKGDSKLISSLDLRDAKRQNKLVRMTGILYLLAACTYPYQELIGWPPVIFGGYQWAKQGTQSVLLSLLIMIIILCVQKAFQKKDRNQRPGK